MVRPKKKWGQNFLRNRGAVARIVAAVEPEAGDLILEIGPGEGILTEGLAAFPNEVLAIEIDPELTAALTQRFGDRVEFRCQDALETVLPTRPFRAVGNLPYNAGTPILRRVIADPHCRRAVFMLQKEVADRLVAKPGHEAYGYLTLYTQLFARARILLTLEPQSFYPPPKVRSAVVVLDPDPRPYLSDDLLGLISMAFRMRRKTLVNNLISWRGLDRADAERAVAEAQLPHTTRAEELSLDAFAALLPKLRRTIPPSS
ncbi:MAG: 16S rRNA (adenine(1518)-N(6)/adenine(1519)-N(6))-dimethyltransferase RsmA [Thermoanaerobaculia bacterium]